MDPDMLLAWCPVSPQSVGDSIMMEGQQNKPIIWFLALGGVLCWLHCYAHRHIVLFLYFLLVFYFAAIWLQQAAQPGSGTIDTTMRFIFLFHKEENCTQDVENIHMLGGAYSLHNFVQRQKKIKKKLWIIKKDNFYKLDYAFSGWTLNFLKLTS